MWFLPNPSQASAHTAKKEVMNDFFFYALFAGRLHINVISAAQGSGTNTYAPPHCSPRFVTAL